VNRRDFLSTGAGAAATILSGCAPGIPLIYGLETESSIRVRKPVAELDAVGGAIRVDVEETGKIILVRRTSVDSYSAISLECAHLGCTVRVEGPQFRCPCHGSSYDADGSVLRGPADRPLRTFPVRATESEFIIDLR